MSDMQPEGIAGGAKEFALTEFGKWYLDQLQTKQKFFTDFAQETDAHSLQTNNIMKAAGIKYALELITRNAKIAESGVFNKK